MKKTFLFILLFLIAKSIFCQHFLLATKGRYKSAKYKKGDIISIRINGDEVKFTDKIIGFDDSLIYFKFYKINPKEISHLYIDSKIKEWYFMKLKYEKLLKIFGIGYLGADLINTKKLDKSTAIISGSAFGLHFLAKKIFPNFIKIDGRKKKLIIIH